MYSQTFLDIQPINMLQGLKIVIFAIACNCKNVSAKRFEVKGGVWGDLKKISLKFSCGLPNELQLAHRTLSNGRTGGDIAVDAEEFELVIEFSCEEHAG